MAAYYKKYLTARSGIFFIFPPAYPPKSGNTFALISAFV